MLTPVIVLNSAAVLAGADGWKVGVSGPVPAQRRHTRSAFLAFGMATPLLSAGEEPRALMASLKSL
jgi:hypothetical protein